MRRISIRRLMIFVALAALTSAMAIMLERSSDYSRMAELQAAFEAQSIALANKATVTGSSGVATNNQLVAYHRDLRVKYERAAAYPWLTVEPEPPQLPIPELPR